MGFGWYKGRRRTDRPSRKKDGGERRDGLAEIIIPSHFLCPISLEMMKDPVTLSSGITYDRDSIERWLEDGNFTCPVTNQVLRSFDQIPNHTIRRMIQEWCTENRFSRIPTPRVPVTPYEVTEVLAGINDAARQGDCVMCLELVQRIESWGSESERNRRCIVVNGAATSLASAFGQFSAGSSMENTHMELMEALMSTLNWMFPLDSEARHLLGLPATLRCMVQFLKNGNLSVQKNTILALKEVCSESQQASALAEIEGVHEILVEFVKCPIHPALTKASLSVMFCLIASSDEERRRFVGLGAVAAVLESLVDMDKSLSEKALGVLDGLTGCEEGMVEGYSNALTVPLIVKKILRVSELATGYSVNILLSLCRHKGDESVKVTMEALQVGAFQKLLVLLQVGCGDKTREKATELLKLMNPYRDELECIESVDFKNLKRSF